MFTDVINNCKIPFKVVSSCLVTFWDDLDHLMDHENGLKIVMLNIKIL